MHVIAIDWSGALVGARDRIWVAEVVDGALVRLESGRTREEVGDFLVERGREDPRVVVGLDFAFSFPAWWLAERGVASGPALWALAIAEGERWLAECERPFWGRSGRRRTIERDDAYRRTEREVPRVAGIAPKSAFQVGGAGAVGTGSIRGMPLLARLHAAGWRVWPFTDRRGSDPSPTAIEIYPRVLTGAVNKSSFAERAEYLRFRFPAMPTEFGVRAAASDDAFDAAVSALAMAESGDRSGALPPARDDTERLEGAIWMPAPPA